MADIDCKAITSTISKLILSAEHYTGICPPLARYYLLEAERIKSRIGTQPSSDSQICRQCCIIRRPGNCTRHLLPRVKANAHIHRLQQKQVNGVAISKRGKNLLKLFDEGMNRMAIQCRQCSKKVLVPCARRPAALPKQSKCDIVEKLKSKKKKKKRNMKLEFVDIETGNGRLPGGKTFALSNAAVNEDVKRDGLVTNVESISKSALMDVTKMQSGKLGNASLSASPATRPSSAMTTPRHTPATATSTPVTALTGSVRKSTRQKLVLKQKHNVLRNILKQQRKSDTTTGLQQFLSLL